MKSLFLVVIAILSSAAAAKVTYNVTSFGAKGDGNTDSTKAFLSAWSSACNSTKSATIYIPTGTFLLATAITFAGERCMSSAITIRIYGTLVASSEYNAIANSGDWIRFHRVNHVTISGGTLDAKGASLWSCKTSGKSCPKGTTVHTCYISCLITCYTLALDRQQKYGRCHIIEMILHWIIYEIQEH